MSLRRMNKKAVISAVPARKDSTGVPSSPSRFSFQCMTGLFLSFFIGNAVRRILAQIPEKE
jgi:hypothetical protein